MTTVNQQSEVNGKAYTVLPDQVTIKANLINAQATDCQTGERVSLVYFPQSEREAQKICQCSNTMKWMISGDERPIEPATNFNQFDSQRYYHQFHIYNQVRCKQLQIEIEQEANFFKNATFYVLACITILNLSPTHLPVIVSS
ncbi:DUF4131 domain-containing protein [Limosilactobacillus fastidiosus]|uniref:DUF4131 domain-containing protein n=1 Tax=Limosilactobacillus fastidiosus TaxID=2759855 RepID=UPI001E3DD448|nr:DUF4131 domain-containing protein [Limosilactobacillus fastidiosus]MCD7085216.1 DUF4131 domain-containing protein [Limosilactobacillus fastidiosus]MCD7115159.1 DUF4131 domain-containing protein [Limosilactobacillus fastidiosus]MCD7115465.1 DUF4131 domain-containing protein [Limosilactobacillus fastidiosus]